MKIVLIGAGSYVFAPTVLRDAIVKHGLACELALVDLNLEAAEAMAGLGRRMATDNGVECRITATVDRAEVLPGADHVILSAAPQGSSRWHTDCEILVAAGMAHQVRECGGLGGLSYTLRTASLALDIAEEMEAICPKARLLDVTNPMPRVVTALRNFTTIEAYGFCNAGQEGRNGYEWLAKLLDRTHEQIEVVTAGLNHFAWVISIRDRATGEDLYPLAEVAVREGHDHGAAGRRRYLETYGAIAAPGPSHVKDFLPPDATVRYGTRPPFHGDAQTRRDRLDLLHAIGRGDVDWRTAPLGSAWEHPVDLAAAIDAANPRVRASLAMPMLNLPNRRYLPELPDGRIVEVPVVVEGGTVRGMPIGPLPGQTAALCRAVSDVHELVAEGAATGDRDALARAIAIDPAVPDKPKALRVLDELLAAHADILPRFA